MTLDKRVSETRLVLAAIEKSHAPAALASSFGAEDMVLLDLIARDGLAIGTFTIDTGRLPTETHALIHDVRKRYGLAIDVFSPWPDSVDGFVSEYGSEGFYDGIEQRKACCAIRKVEPLRRALRRKRAWITGLRREQADSRTGVPLHEYDTTHGLWKFNPLVEWTHEEVWTYLRNFDVPYNALHDRGYPSIGCAPCTRAVKPGEHPRAGRWWWENPESTECGLHPIKE